MTASYRYDEATMFESTITRLSFHAVSLPKVYPMVVEKSVTEAPLTTSVLGVSKTSAVSTLLKYPRLSVYWFLSVARGLHNPLVHRLQV